MRRLLILPLLFCLGCGLSSSGSGSSAEATAAAPASASAKPPEGAELETLIQSSPGFQEPRRYFVHHTGYVPPTELEVYHALERNDYIKIDAETPERRTTTPGASVIVSLTDRGSALPGVQKSGETFGLPLAHQRIISATLKEQKAADGSYLYDVVYDWQNDDVGNLIGSDLPERMRPPDGQFQVPVSIRKISSGWMVRLYGRPTLIDR